MAGRRHDKADFTFGGPAFSFRGFRRDYDNSDDDTQYSNNNDDDNDDGDGKNDGPAAAAAFSAACPPEEDLRPIGSGDVNTRCYDVDSDEDDPSCGGWKGRKKRLRFYSSSSSSQSPFRSCKSSLSPENSQDEYQDARESPEGKNSFSTSSQRQNKDKGNGDDNDHNNDDNYSPRKGKDKKRISFDDEDDYFSDEDDYDDKDEDENDNDEERSKAVVPQTKMKGQIGRIQSTKEEEEEEEYEDEGWKDLPMILLEDIFVLLTPKQRHQASMVCRPWYEIFYSPRVWETFILFERTLTRKRYNMVKGYQRELCPRKAQLCFLRVGCYFKRIVVTPISDYYNLYEFLRVLAAFLVYYNEFPMPLLHTFRFTFACESRGMNGMIIIGTGGNILDKVKDLLGKMQQLRHLALNQLLLDVEEVPGLLSAAAKTGTDSLHSVELLNCSKVPYPLCEVTQFTQLLTLKLTAQHLNEEVVLLLGGTQLLQLYIVQDAYTCSCSPVSGEAWKLFKEMAPNKRVFLEIQGLTKVPLMLQPHAPVHGVIFRTPYHRLLAEQTTWIIEYYGKHLEYFVQEALPRAHGSRKFAERADESLMRLVRECPHIHTLVVRERISLATLLLMAQEGRHKLRQLLVRKNALIKKCEWPKAKGWSSDYYRWLKQHGKNYDLAFQQVPALLGKRWKPTDDRIWKHMRIHIT